MSEKPATMTPVSGSPKKTLDPTNVFGAGNQGLDTR